MRWYAMLSDVDSQLDLLNILDVAMTTFLVVTKLYIFELNS